MRIVLKFTIYFFVVAFVPILIFGIMTYNKGKEALEAEAFNRLKALREVKANQITDYFDHLQSQVVTYSEDPTIVEAMQTFKRAFAIVNDETGGEAAVNRARQNVEAYKEEYFYGQLNSNLSEDDTAIKTSTNPATLLLQDAYIANNPHDVGSKHELYKANDGSTYSEVHAKYHPILKNYLERFGYYDIFLIDAATGHIVYSVYKEVDFATSLTTGSLKNTNLARAFTEANAAGDPDFVELEDYEPYQPSYNAHASFIASPIFANGERIGILAFQMPIDRINAIMTNKEDWEDLGLGYSGETYLVGADHTLRNQSRFLIEDNSNYFKLIKDIGTPQETIDKIRNFNSTIGLQEVRTEGTEAALNGETDTRIFKDYRGVTVLSAFKPLDIPELDWVIMSEIDEDEALIPVMKLRNSMIVGVCILALFIIIVAFLVARQVTRPIKKLTRSAVQVARGKYDVEVQIQRKDEIGMLAASFRKMQISIRNLIKDLKEINQSLEDKVADRTAELSLQKDMVEEKNKEILDSINYAQRLQHAILPTRQLIKANLPDSFVMYRPKDIVSGDFYWMEVFDDTVLFAVVDCTGHGVPGAMLSVVGANNLNRCVKEFGLRQPADILDKLTELIVETLDADNSDVNDGMDISLVAIDKKTKEVQFAGAHNGLWIVRNATIELEEVKGNKQPIGRYDYRTAFTNHTLQLKRGDCIYLTSDGYADQFGGEKGKKLKSSVFKSMMVGIHDHSMERQCEVLEEAFDDWKGNHEQLDDVCVMGWRV